MKIFFKKYCSPEGQGNIGYGEPLAVPAGTKALNAANDGLSLDSTGLIAQLGQSQGTAGNPAKLLGVREIPMNGKRLFFVSGIFPAYNGAIGFDGFTIDVFNDGSTGAAIFHAFNGTNNISFDLLSAAFTVDTGDGNFFKYDYVTKNWGTNFGGDASIISGAGLGANITHIVDPVVAYSVVKSDFFILIDTSGAITITANPALQKNQILMIRDINANLGNSTFQLSSGLLYGQVAQPPVASIVIGAGTGGLIFYCDGINMYQVSRL